MWLAVPGRLIKRMSDGIDRTGSDGLGGVVMTISPLFAVALPGQSHYR